MSADIQEILCKTLKRQQFDLQIDKSTLIGNDPLLLGYGRLINDNIVMQELLFLKNLNKKLKMMMFLPL